MDIKIIETHVEDVEKQHHQHIVRFIREHERAQEQQPPPSHQPLKHADVKWDGTALKDTLEALSDRTLVGDEDDDGVPTRTTARKSNGTFPYTDGF